MSNIDYSKVEKILESRERLRTKKRELKLQYSPGTPKQRSPQWVAFEKVEEHVPELVKDFLQN